MRATSSSHRWLLIGLLSVSLTSTAGARPHGSGPVSQDYDEEMAMHMEGGEIPPEGPALDEGPPFADVIADYERQDGLFTFYVNKDTGHAFVALRPDQIGPLYMMSGTLNAGSGGGMFIAPMMWPEMPFYFKKTFKTVQLMRPNPTIWAEEGTPIARAVARGTSESVIMTLMPSSAPAPAPPEVDDEQDKGDSVDDSMEEADDDAKSETEAIEGDMEASDDEAEDEVEEELPPIAEGTVLYDAGMIFMADPLGVMSSPWGGFGVDPMGSFITRVDTFPENVNLELTLNVMGGMSMDIFGGTGGGGSDPRSEIIKLAYAISQIPTDNGFAPRLSDERVGYFLTMKQDYTRDDQDDRYIRYINRWHLEKQDPSAAVSDPVEPIVYWIENTVPEEYRAAVAEGIEAWQPAFEAAGFSNGIIAKQMPDDADWDPADVRYNVIRWFVAPGASFAIGPSRANPYTGQLYDADIGFSADMVAFGAEEYRHLVNPLGMIEAERLRGAMLGIVPTPGILDLMAAGPDGAAMQTRLASLTAIAQRVQQHAGHAQMGCTFAHEASADAAAAFTALQLRGDLRPGSAEEAQFVHDFIVSITIHEVGHTLGLRHNYKGSVYHDGTNLASTEVTDLSGSSMDYTGTNVASRRRQQGAYFQTTVGPYDINAIKYGYTPIEADEQETLSAIANQISAPGLAYATDEDTFGWTAAMDPTSQAWDLATDSVDYYGDQIQAAKELWGSLDLEYHTPGTRYQKYRTGFGWGLRQYGIAAMNVPRNIGGIYHSRNRVGDPDGTNPYTPVPAVTQRATLKFLIDNYFAPTAFQFSPDLLSKLAIEREPDFAYSAFYASRRDIPIHDIIEGMQLGPLAWCYDPLVLGRLVDSPALLPPGTDVMTIAELFGGLRGAIWQEAFTKTSVNSVRRNLQRDHLMIATAIYLYGGGYYPQDAVTLARKDLTTVRDALKGALASTTIDGITRAHFEQSLEEVERTLNAQTSKMSLFY